MKDKLLILTAEPCSTPLEDPRIQTLSDAQHQGAQLCRYYSDRAQCSPPRFGCVRLAGQKVARHLLLFYAEASERTLAMEVKHFSQNALLPPGPIEAYVDTPEHGHRRITAAEQVVQRVGECARAILGFKPRERVFRDTEEPVPPPREAAAMAKAVA